MAQNILNTRVLLRSDIKSNREVSNVVLMKGEAFVEYSTVEREIYGEVVSIPQAHIFFGDGVTALKNLTEASNMTPLEIKELIDSATSAMAVENVEDADDSYANITLTSADGLTKQVVAIKGKAIKVSADEETNEILIDNSELNNASKVTIVRDTESEDYACQYHFYQGIKTVETEVDDETKPIADADGNEPDSPDWIPTYEKKTVTEDVPDVLLETVNIPLDMVLKDASFITVTQEMIDSGDAPEEITYPSVYMKMEIANSDNTVIYLDMKEMFNSYTVDDFNNIESENFGGEIAIDISDDYKIKAEIQELSVMKLVNSKNEADVLILYGGDSGVVRPADFTISADGNNLVFNISGGDDRDIIAWSVYSGKVKNDSAKLDSGEIVDYVGNSVVTTNVEVLATGVEGDEFLVVIDGVEKVYTIPVVVYTEEMLNAMDIADILLLAIDKGYELVDGEGSAYDESSDKAEVISAFLAAQG